MYKKMPRTWLSTVLLTASMAFLSGCGHSDSNSRDNPLGLITPDHLRVASMGDSRPNTYTDENGNFTGFDIEYFRAVAKRMGIHHVDFVGQDFSAILPSVANGQFDAGVASIAITPQRQQTVDFSNGYLAGYIVLVGKPNGPIKDLDHIAGHRVGVTQGTIEDTYANDHFKDSQIVRFPDYNSAISALNNGTVDTVFTDYNPAQAYKKQYGLVSIADIPAFDQPAAVAIAKGRPKLKAAINKAIKSTMADGTWLKLWKKWFPSVPVPKMYTPEANK